MGECYTQEEVEGMVQSLLVTSSGTPLHLVVLTDSYTLPGAATAKQAHRIALLHSHRATESHSSIVP